MCGILGAYSRSQSLSNDLLKAGLRQLEHRGPDSQNTWIGANGRIGLGHSRLSIIDLSTGHQPLTDSSESIHAVVNGELYGYKEIRADLEKLGHRFKTQSDSEIVIHLYKQYGTQCLHHLRGEFSFILWDQANETLFAARDRFGIKPLYYHSSPELLALGSEMKALFPLGIAADWDPEVAYQLHSAFLFLPSRTLFNKIYQVPPGHFLLATQGNVQIMKYWDYSFPTVDQLRTSSISEVEAIHDLRTLLNESVRLRLQADVPVACYLSGGLDSCAVLGVASQYVDQPIHAFTLSFDQEAYDEEKIAREMATHAGAHYTPISVTQNEVADAFEKAIWHSEIPLINNHGVAKFLLSKAVRSAGFKVVLTGEGSDEVFAGYPHFRKDLFLTYPVEQANAVQNLLQELSDSNEISKGLLLSGDSPVDIPSLRNTLGHVSSYLESNAGVGRRLSTLLNPDFARTYENRDPFRVLLNQLDCTQMVNRDSVNQSLYLWSKTMLPNYILSVLGDRMEMGNSIEGRVPFLDHKIVEFAAKLPIQYKIKGTTEKFILREAAKSVLTSTVYKRQKHPFLAPPVSAQPKGPMLNLMQDTFRSTEFKRLPFYDANRVISLLDSLPSLSSSEQNQADLSLTLMLSMYSLQKNFKPGTALFSS